MEHPGMDSIIPHCYTTNISLIVGSVGHVLAEVDHALLCVFPGRTSQSLPCPCCDLYHGRYRGWEHDLVGHHRWWKLIDRFHKERGGPQAL